MNTPKALFLKDDTLRDQFNAVSHQDWFARTLAYAMAELVTTSTINSEQLAGAKMAFNTLLELGDQEPGVMAYPSSGLHHELDVIVKTPKKAE